MVEGFLLKRLDFSLPTTRSVSFPGVHAGIIGIALPSTIIGTCVQAWQSKGRVPRGLISHQTPSSTVFIQVVTFI